MGVLYMVVLSATLALILIHAVVLFRQQTAIPGSYKKFQLTTILIVIVSLKILTKLGVVILSLLFGYWLTAGIWLGLAAFDILDLIKLFKDDNWFNNQYKRFKQGLKNLRARLSTFLSPLPAPA